MRLPLPSRPVMALLACAAAFAGTAGAAPSDCVGCDDQVTPLAVTDWRSSRHAQEGIGCDACHKGNHRSAGDVANLTVITAQTCGGRHERQMLEFTAGKHSRAWAAAKALPTAHAPPMAMGPAAADCGACHKIGFKSEAEIVQLRTSGSVFGHASCDSCHTRHAFSVMEARQPQACRDLPHGIRSPAMGDVLELEARRPGAAEAERDAAGQHAGAALSGLPHGQRQSRGTRPLGDSSECGCRSPTTRSGARTRRRSCRRSACSMPRANRRCGSRNSATSTWRA